ncbi:MAG: DUF1259 domain-containing protein [Desulfomonile tiedjei]|nr:DUF1259 domain-containing protein [Desulfomonile tiedjei]
MTGFTKSFILSLPLLLSSFIMPTFSLAAGDLRAVQQILGPFGQLEDGVLLFRYPRSDINVKVDGEPIPTALGFGSWVAWKSMGKDVIVLGDLALLDKEVNPVLSALQAAGMQMTGLHTRYFGDRPRVMFMHISGKGDASKLATAVSNALGKTATPVAASAAESASQPSLNLDTKRLQEIVGRPGQAAGGAFKIVVGRPGVRMHGTELPSAMGVNSWAGFVGTNEKAHVAGDVAMSDHEVNRVIKALQKGGIQVVGLHNHMMDETPRVFFLYFWGTGPAEKLAQTVRAAFDEAKGPIKGNVQSAESRGKARVVSFVKGEMGYVRRDRPRRTYSGQ